MHAHQDDEQTEFLDGPSLLGLGLPAALLLLGLNLWLVTDSDVLASSQSEAAWDAAIGAPVDRTTPLDADSKEIVMHRSGCEGTCPIYEVRLRSDGQVSFVGESFVCAFGERTARVDPYTVRHLMRAMEAVKFEQIPVHQQGMVDVPVTTLLLVSERGSTGVAYQEQDDDALIKMGARIDAIAETSRWLPLWSDAASARVCPMASGTVRLR